MMVGLIKVDLNAEMDEFQEVISLVVQLLVKGLEAQCEPSIVMLSKTKWENVEEVGDTSLYVLGFLVTP